MKTKSIYDKVCTISTSKESVKLYLEFLKRNNQTDLLIYSDKLYLRNIFIL